MLRQMSYTYKRPFIGGQSRIQCFRVVLLEQGHPEPCLTAPDDKAGKYSLTILQSRSHHCTVQSLLDIIFLSLPCNADRSLGPLAVLFVLSNLPFTFIVQSRIISKSTRWALAYSKIATWLHLQGPPLSTLLVPPVRLCDPFDEGKLTIRSKMTSRSIQASSFVTVTLYCSHNHRPVLMIRSTGEQLEKEKFELCLTPLGHSCAKSVLCFFLHSVPV
jgi:hypothetical protein